MKDVSEKKAFRKEKTVTCKEVARESDFGKTGLSNKTSTGIHSKENSST